MPHAAKPVGPADLPDPRDLPEDRERSPHTGWTRAHWEAAADLLLGAAARYVSPAGARYELPGPRPSRSGPDSDALEGFARTFLLAAFRIAGIDAAASATGAADPAADAYADLLADRYAAGFAAGADKAHPEAWMRIEAGPGHTQPMVEAASLALGLHLTRDRIWARLDERARADVAGWLGGFVGMRTCANNWVLFQTVVEEFLSSVGAPYAEHEIVRGLDDLEGWVLGDGWYTDGAGRRVDHYNGWALHLYPLLWTRMAAGGPRDGLARERAPRYRERLRAFLGDYTATVGGNGSPLHQGRSLTYRFSAAAPLWTGALFDATPSAPGLTRRAASGMLTHFFRHDAPGRDGLLTLGWHRPFEPMLQPYSGPASPYWASKGFVGLLLPPTHPVWTDRELPLPAESVDALRPVPAVGWLIHSTSADGVVRVHNHGSDNQEPHGPVTEDPHYARLAYTTSTAPVTGLPNAELTDNQLTLVTPRGDASIRGPIRPLGAVALDEGVALARSAHRPHSRVAGEWRPVPGAAVVSATLATGRWELRLHRVTAPEGFEVRETGYSVAAAEPPASDSTDLWHTAVRPDGLRTALAPAYGWDASGEPRGGVTGAAGADAMGAHSAVPWLAARHPGGTALYATCVLLSAEPFDVAAEVPFTVLDSGADGPVLDAVRVRLPDGREVLVPLHDTPDVTSD
jgi:hypothetical protein